MAAYATVTLTGTYQTPDGNPHKGTVEVIPSERVIKDTTGDVILTGRVKVQLDEAGSFTVALPATDDPTLNPTGFGYTLAAKLHSTHLPAVSFSLPAATPVVDIEDVTPVDPSTFVPEATYVEASELDAIDMRITTLETTPSVTSYNDLTDTPAIPATAADVGAEPAGLSAETEAVLAGTFVPQQAGVTLSDNLLPKATPVEAGLTFSNQYAAMGLAPKSIGTDGWVYGSYNNTQMWRSGDKLATRQLSTQVFTGKSVLWVGRVTEGYVALVINAGNGELWFSTGWDTGWALKQSIGPVGGLSCPHPKRGPNGTVLIVGEYVTGVYPSTVMNLWLSQDGGQTWANVRQSTVTDSNINTHWHASDYDEKRQRIWACNGDSVNSWFGYSDNFGATWVNAPLPTTSPLYDGIAFQQPTTIMVVEDHIILTPDRGEFPSGVWVMDADTLAVESRYALPGGEITHEQYGLGAYYGRRGKEIYLTFPDTGSGNKKTYIVASGDYGRSWHLAYTVDWGTSGGSLSVGIVGPDQNGRLYFQGQSLPTFGSGIAWANALTWEWSTPA